MYELDGLIPTEALARQMKATCGITGCARIQTDSELRDLLSIDGVAIQIRVGGGEAISTKVMAGHWSGALNKRRRQRCRRDP